MRSFLATLRRDGTPGALLTKLPTIAEFVDTLGMGEVRDLETRFGHWPT
jgi:hypothetical protein